MGYHQPVLLEECIDGLVIQPGGTYIDATFGGGGHSNAILNKLTTGKLFAFDQDEDVNEIVNSIKDPRFAFIPVNFRYMKKYLRLNGVNKVNGILADLGVSSHQIDTPDRGFSTRFDAELDMRMDQGADLTAKIIINTYDEASLQKVLSQYGEVRNAKTLAATIVDSRKQSPINTIAQFKLVIKHLIPRSRENQYLAQVFQALRIEVNGEMEALEALLYQCRDLISIGGRLVVISYHSLEDRIVKNYINKGVVHGDPVKDFYGNLLRPFKPVVKKPITPGVAELQANTRSRSARLRIAERV
ncbi:MAG: ribosomal RNA small subunit methyltransferase H [Cyclobacteriaceae bacterium]|nr:MAG: ribosomal RNA small subunit methyltransferase H [Cyclobacteriaceae bacterium]